MPIGTRARAVSSATALHLPPSFRAVALREVGDAFAHAQAIAPEQGAGTLVWVGRFDLVEFALVIEPDEPLRTARRAHYAGMVALADALAVHAPPEKPIAFAWPDAVLVDAGLVGGGRLAWPAGAAEDAPPAWVVFGAILRTVAMQDGEPGLRHIGAALEEEGFDDLGSGRLLESFARHFMVAVDTWQEQGFGAIARQYLAKLPTQSGLRREIEENGDLLVRRTGKGQTERQRLVTALAAPSWLDPTTGAPRL
jgi:biotin-(acetyl-CoA carboxylase) ligase